MFCLQSVKFFALWDYWPKKERAREHLYFLRGVLTEVS